MILTEAALARPMFRELVSKVHYEIRTVDGKRRFKLENSNKLLPKYDGMRASRPATRRRRDAAWSPWPSAMASRC